jgi:hypothetical protein
MRALRRARANMSRSNLAHACGWQVNARTSMQPEVCTVSHLLWGNLMRRVIEMGVAAPPAAFERATASLKVARQRARSSGWHLSAASLPGAAHQPRVSTPCDTPMATTR